MRLTRHEHPATEGISITLELNGNELKGLARRSSRTRTAWVHLREAARGVVSLSPAETLRMMADLAEAVEREGLR